MATKRKAEAGRKSDKPFYRRGWPYATAGGIALAVAGALTFQTLTAEPPPPPEDPGPKAVALSVDTPAYAWLSSLSSEEAPAVDREAPLVDGMTCSVLQEAPLEALATQKITVDEQELSAQILAPGTSGKTFEDILKNSGTCWPKKVEELESSGYRSMPAGEGFLAQIGDVLVYTEEPDAAAATKQFDAVAASLTESACLSTEVRVADYTRNAHFSQDEYTGKIAVEEIQSNIPLDGLPKVVVPELAEIEDPEAKEPDGPLDPSIPSTPDEVTKPTFASAPDLRTEPFVSDARYQVSDVEGPGCGWGWTQWELPTETEEDLASSKEAGILRAQVDANAEATAYVQTQVDYASGNFTSASSADNWNSYVRSTNKAHEKWNWLNKKRDEVKPKWEAYVKAYNYWKDFDSLQADADEEYSEARENCREANRARDDWDSQYDASEGDGGGDTGIPERPAGCDKEPKPPEILSKEKPRQPIPPELEAGVTIPDSWDQPK